MTSAVLAPSLHVNEADRTTQLRSSTNSSLRTSSLVSDSEGSWPSSPNGASPRGGSPTRRFCKKLARVTPWVPSLPHDDDEDDIEEEEEEISGSAGERVGDSSADELSSSAPRLAAAAGLPRSGSKPSPTFVSPFDAPAAPVPENADGAVAHPRRPSLLRRRGLFVTWRDAAAPGEARLSSMRLFQDSSYDRDMRTPYKEGCCSVM